MNNFNKNKTSEKNKNSNKSEADKKIKYCESKIINGFLESKDGISFLITSQNVTKSKNIIKKNQNVEKKINELIDFYTTWSNSFPVRKNLKITKYEFLKSIEKFCEKNEIKEKFKRVLDI